MGDDSVLNDNRRSWEEEWMRGEPVRPNPNPTPKKNKNRKFPSFSKTMVSIKDIHIQCMLLNKGYP